MQHFHSSTGDMNLGCVLVLTANNLMGWFSGFCGGLSGLQIVAIVMSIGASAYVIINQHKTLMWKYDQERKERGLPPRKKGEGPGLRKLLKMKSGGKN